MSTEPAPAAPSTHELAGRPAPEELLVDVPALLDAYHSARPDPENPAERVSFGTSGHRGSSLDGTFCELHIAAVVQAVCEYRAAQSIDGPLYLARDTHALSEAAYATALEVLAANGVTLRHQPGAYTPTPVISHAILTYNAGREQGLADGLILTPSHNPPEDGGIKYNPPTGGPAQGEATAWIEQRANELLASPDDISRTSLERARGAETTHTYDFVMPYVQDLARVLDMEAIREAGVKIGVDPMGGATVEYWDVIAEMYGLDLEVVNPEVDPTFRFMTVDGDGKIRMDCSSPHAMAGLIDLRERFDVAVGSDPDGDRHGIVTEAGLMNPNHYLSVAVNYLFQHRPEWGEQVGIGKTLVSSSMIDRVARALGRELIEVPVGFKWFVGGLHGGTLGFGGEESAGASFLRKDGGTWTTDKDGILLSLLAAEITAVTGEVPSTHYDQLAERHGRPHYARIDRPATRDQKAALKQLDAESVTASELAGEPIEQKLTHAPGNGAPIGGLKVTSENGWFAARPSGTEDIYKIYAESFKSEAHLRQIQEQAAGIAEEAFRG